MFVCTVFTYKVCWRCTSQWYRIHDLMSDPLDPWRSSPPQSPSHMSHPVKTHKQAAVPQRGQQWGGQGRDRRYRGLLSVKTLGSNQNTAVRTLSLSWIKDFLAKRPQTVRLGPRLSSTLTLSTSSPQGCELSLLLYSLYTYDCTPTHPTNLIIKSADNTTVFRRKQAGRQR